MMELKILFMWSMFMPSLATELPEMQVCSASAQKSILPKVLSCEPRKSVVALPTPNASVIHSLPLFVEAMRCGGACSSRYHSCVSSSTRVREVQVLQTWSDGLSRCATVSVEEALSCTCGCNKDLACDTDRHEFEDHFCSCVCKDKESRALCLSRQWHWDDQSCQCMCVPPHKWPECGSNHAFDAFNTCECVDLQQRAATIIEVLLLILVAAVSLAVAGILSCYRTNTAFFRDSVKKEEAQQRRRRLAQRQRDAGQEPMSNTELRTLFRALSCSADEKDDDDDDDEHHDNTKKTRMEKSDTLMLPIVPHRLRACTK